MTQFTRCTSCANRQAQNADVVASLCPGCRANMLAIEELQRSMIYLKNPDAPGAAAYLAARERADESDLRARIGKAIDAMPRMGLHSTKIDSILDAVGIFQLSPGDAEDAAAWREAERRIAGQPASNPRVLRTASKALIFVRETILASLRSNVTNVRESELSFAANNAAQVLAPMAELVDAGIAWARADKLADDAADAINALQAEFRALMDRCADAGREQAAGGAVVFDLHGADIEAADIGAKIERASLALANATEHEARADATFKAFAKAIEL